MGGKIGFLGIFPKILWFVLYYGWHWWGSWFMIILSNKKKWINEIHINSTFLCPWLYFGDSGNQIWKFKYRYFGKFSDFEFNKYHIFWTLDFYQIKIGLSLKSLGTTALKCIHVPLDGCCCPMLSTSKPGTQFNLSF